MNAYHRVWEIDFLRGIAIIMMVFFHLVVDLTDYYGYQFNYLTSFWYYEGKLTALLFILVAGISSSLSSSNFWRGLIIFGWAMVLTVITYMYNPYTYIRFGILHLLGISMIAYHYLKSVRLVWLWLLALTLLGMGLGTLPLQSSLLIPFGLPPANFVSLDYYPIIPWTGVFLIGVLCSRYIYQQPKSLFQVPPQHGFINYLGRHSLMIYLIHQPLILAGLYILNNVVRGII